MTDCGTLNQHEIVKYRSYGKVQTLYKTNMLTKIDVTTLNTIYTDINHRQIQVVLNYYSILRIIGK